LGLRDKLRSGEVTPSDFFGQLLRLVYRLIFLLAAEDRDLLHPPGASAAARKLYAQGYSLAALRYNAVRRAAWDRHHDRWEGLLITFAALARGEKRLGLPALDGLFAPGTLADLETATCLNTLWSGIWIRQSGSQRIIGSFNNGAVGTALGQANGIQALDRTRQVVALCGDGGFNMLMCEFLTAMHHELPVKVVVYNNSQFGLIVLEAEGAGLPAYKPGIEFPNSDFSAFARACGGQGFRATKPGELHAAISEAFEVDGPVIVDCVVAADELPNFPHIELGQAEHYAAAKIKEAILAVTGR